MAYEGDIQFKYIAYGAIEKTIYVLVDNVEVHKTTTSASGKQTTLTFDAMSHGIHTIEIYAIATLNDSTLRSDHLKYDVICLETDKTDVLISSVYNIETVKQGYQVSIPYIVYDPANLTSDISLIRSFKINGICFKATAEVNNLFAQDYDVILNSSNLYVKLLKVSGKESISIVDEQQEENGYEILTPQNFDDYFYDVVSEFLEEHEPYVSVWKPSSEYLLFNANLNVFKDKIGSNKPLYNIFKLSGYEDQKAIAEAIGKVPTLEVEVV